MTLVFPGSKIPCFERSGEDGTSVNTDGGAVKLGPGLFQNEQQDVIAVKAGLLHHREGSNKWWIESNQRRYVPAVGETVVGVVVARLAEAFRVDIGAAHPAVLPMMAFEGASKRNKPNLTVGMLVYARVSMASKDMDPELECVNASTGKADGYGELKGGNVFKTSLGLARSLRTSTHPMLQLLSKQVAFEIASGMNGIVWVNAKTPAVVIMIINALKASESMSPQQMEECVKGVTKRLKKA
ncbi:exosome non-catalytic core subunit rrp40 [Sorochytrium milnesiophthora]